jgi:hypothetical protein
MSSPTEVTHQSGEAGAFDQTSLLFSQLIFQQSNMAMMLLGKTPHPETGKVERDLEGARFFIDQLEMLDVKTRGNLNKQEESLLKQTLMALRLAFVEAVESASEPTATPEPASKAAEPAQSLSAEPPTDAKEEGSRKKFSKTY